MTFGFLAEKMQETKIREQEAAETLSSLKINNIKH